MYKLASKIVWIVFSILFCVSMLYSSESQIERRAKERLLEILNLSSEQHPIKSVLVPPGLIDSLRNTLPPAEGALFKTLFERPELDTFHISSGEHFKIHYDLTGDNAPEMEFNLNEEVPDWVIYIDNYAERVWRLLMDTLGYDPPPADGVDGDYVDLYVKELAGSAYGWTYPDDPVTSTARPYDYTAYTELDNDYQESRYSTRGLEALRVTIAHEFFHIVQLGYNWYPHGQVVSGGDQWFMEMSSTWFEERAYPEVNDYIQYLNPFFYDPTHTLWYSSYWYSLPIFLHYLTHEYGDRLLTDVWEGIKSREAFLSLQNELKNHDSSLENEWTTFGIRVFFTGSRYNGDSIFPDAMLYPEFRINSFPYHDFRGTEGEYHQLLEMDPFSLKFFFLTSDKDCEFSLRLASGSSGAMGKTTILRERGNVILGLTANNATRVSGFNAGDTLLITVVNPDQKNIVNQELDIRRYISSFKLVGLTNLPYRLFSNEDFGLYAYLNRDFDQARVEVYDLLGRLIMVYKIDQQYLGQSLDRRYIPLDGMILRLRTIYVPSGLYLFRFKFNEQEKVLKVILLK